jgi:polyisoprenoid-binding protein YceI
VRRRLLVIGGIALAVLIVGGVAGTLVLRAHHAHAPLALGSPTPAATAGGLTGNWKVAAGSQAGYRVREKFINQPSPTEAVARTTKISGGLVVKSAGGSTLQATSLHFTADLTALVSQDKYAVFQTYQRDFFIRNIYLMTDQFPNADFTADSATIPVGTTSGPVSLSVTGMLTVHGVTKAVTTQLNAQLSGDQVQVVGSIHIDMRDFNVSPPDISFTKAEPGAVIEYSLVLVRA